MFLDDEKENYWVTSLFAFSIDVGFILNDKISTCMVPIENTGR